MAERCTAEQVLELLNDDFDVSGGDEEIVMLETVQ